MKGRDRSNWFTHFSIGDSKEAGEAHRRINKRPHVVWKNQTGKGTEKEGKGKL